MLRTFDLSPEEAGMLRSIWLTPTERGLWQKMARQFEADFERQLLTCSVDEVTAVRESRKTIGKFFKAVEATATGSTNPEQQRSEA